MTTGRLKKWDNNGFFTIFVLSVKCNAHVQTLSEADIVQIQS